MIDHLERYRVAADACETNVFWHPQRSPAEVLAVLAESAAAYDLTWDRYGEHGPVEQLEAELTELFGTEAAAFFPSGTMAQQCVLRTWCDRAGTLRVALPDLAHPLVHEAGGPALLHGFRFEHLTTGRRTPDAEALAAIPGRLAAVMVELPLRDAGCVLPTWDELVALSTATRERGAAFHVDGARIWESQPFYGRSYAEIAALADTMYVSFYKGLGAIAGAALIGPRDVLDEARLWRERMGGTLFHATAEAVSALVGIREELPHLADHLTWARALATELPAHGITPNPDPPHIATFEVFAAGDVDEVNERLLALMDREKLQLSGLWRAAGEPGRVTTELMCAGSTRDHDPGRVAALLGEVVG
ncbi:MAG: beta-eliminating lyase-related protein [Nocardioides sp.]